MPNSLPLPDDLEHLLERRDSGDGTSEDRRKNSDGHNGTERRSGSDRRANKARKKDAQTEGSVEGSEC